MNFWNFILYTVRGSAWQATVLSPATCYERIDVPFWLHQQAGDPAFSITVLSHFPHIQQSEHSVPRRAALQRLPQPAILDRYNQLQPWISGMRGKRLLFSEVLHAYRQSSLAFVKNAQSTLNQLAGYSGQTSDELTTFLCQLQILYLLGCFDWTTPFSVSTCRRCGYGPGAKSDQQQRRFVSGAYVSLATGLKRVLASEQLVPSSCERCAVKSCLYCPNCLQLGRVRSCEPLLTWSPQADRLFRAKMTMTERVAETKRRGSVRCMWQGELTAAQQEASGKLLDFVRDEAPSSREFLIWAVCGAGKTELLFQALAYALQHKQNVLIASPRSDVVRELAPRLEQAFPMVRVVALHAESKQKSAPADLYVATTHQIMRFYRFFDLVMIDEVDAFPYSCDRKLAYAVGQALKPEGKLVYMTATPDRLLIRRVRRGELAAVEITRRYHGQPLAVPRIIPIGRWRQWMQTGIVSSELSAWLQSLIEQERFAYLFVPHVKDLPLVERYVLDTLLPFIVRRLGQSPTFPVASVHAQHPDRTGIVQRFRRHEIRLLLTTSILERGVTIPFCDVAVLGSDDPVFSTAALIQMAGRTGRKTEDPLGHVSFFPQVRTRTQLACIKQIQRWNEVQ